MRNPKESLYEIARAQTSHIFPKENAHILNYHVCYMTLMETEQKNSLVISTCSDVVLRHRTLRRIRKTAS